jgi:O-antigen/teichoic acid export membrane protein
VIESILKETGKDALRYVPAKVIPAAVNFAGLLVFTHILSPEDYGNYFIVLTTISVMTIIGSNWVANSVIRFYPEFKLKGDLDRFFSNVVFAFVICNWILLLLFILGFLVFEARIPPALTSMLTVGIFAYLSSAAYFVLLYFLRASQQASVFSVCEILSSVGRLGLALLLVFLLKTGAINLLWAMLVISTIISILISRRFSLGKRLKAGLFSSETCKDLAKFGLPLAVSSLSAWLLVLSDRYILDYFGSAEQVGIYSVSFSVVDRSIGMLYSILMLAAYPIIISTWEEKGKQMTQQLIQELSRYFFILCIPAFVGLSILSKDVFTLFMGKDFIESFRLVPFFAFCSLLMGLFQYSGKGFEIYKKTFLLAVTFLIAGLVNVALNVLLIPSHGYMGAGMAKAISYSLLIILGIKMTYSFMPWLVRWKSLLNVVFSAILMGAVLVFLKRFLAVTLTNLIILIVAGTGVYCVVLLICREIKKSETDFVKSYFLRLVKNPNR